jgi:hypothetical protein
MITNEKMIIAIATTLGLTLRVTVQYLKGFRKSIYKIILEMIEAM